MTIISGLSGAGKSLAVATFEDMGYFCIDNLPPQMLTQVAKLFSLDGSKVNRAALVLDARAGDSLSYLDDALAELDRLNVLCRVVFLEASDEALVARFHSTRRTHPLTGSDNLVEGIQREREILGELRERADVVIDTTSLNVHDLRRHIQETVLAGELQDQILMTFMSFGYKYGVPREVDMVFDARFLPNPHWVPELRPLTGMEEPVRDYVLAMEQTQGFVERVVDLLTYLTPSYLVEQKRQLLVGVGCTGGRHRSVALAQTLASALEQVPAVVTAVRHRDVGRKG
ncbi:MAG TPA: RNase adapter RapZ [Thermoleophilia bacterium]|nr:RNase adapter RapZ [Thermoleophilia bacterium]